jgi:hypothetical protein
VPPSLGASCKEIRKISVANVYTIYTFTETHATLMGGTILVADAIKITTQNMLKARVRAFMFYMEPGYVNKYMGLSLN